MPGPDKNWADHIAAEVKQHMAAEALKPAKEESAVEVSASTPTVWPPAPSAAATSTQAGGAKFCPSCGRKLLTQTSALCNWCGKKIDDPDYQQRAAQTRLERDAADRQAVEAAKQQEAEYGMMGSIKRRAKERKGADLQP
jgi:predicted amidophosphoribosyltransferase